MRYEAEAKTRMRPYELNRIGAELAEAVLAHNEGIATMKRDVGSYESENLRVEMVRLAREFQKATGG